MNETFVFVLIFLMFVIAGIIIFRGNRKLGEVTLEQARKFFDEALAKYPLKQRFNIMADEIIFDERSNISYLSVNRKSNMYIISDEQNNSFLASALSEGRSTCHMICKINNNEYICSYENKHLNVKKDGEVIFSKDFEFKFIKLPMMILSAKKSPLLMHTSSYKVYESDQWEKEIATVFIGYSSNGSSSMKARFPIKIVFEDKNLDEKTRTLILMEVMLDKLWVMNGV